MRRDDLYDLAAFAVVAEKGSFTRAAAELGMSQSALSHAIKLLEQRMGVRLLSRTTRSVSVTDAGEKLLRALSPALEDISVAVDEVGAMSGIASGSLRITATKHAISSVLMPMLPAFLDAHPDIEMELIADDRMLDIVAERIDAGIRFGDIVERDMIAVRISPDIGMVVVGAPSYFENSPPLETPRQLADHRCITYRNIRSGGLIAWDFIENGTTFQVRVEGQLVLNNSDLIREAALAGRGLAYVYENEVAADIASGRLVRALDNWCPNLPGYYLYHPSRRQSPPALAAFIAALRRQG
jgi:DNA-binding transcriptional LysR family regulator